MKCEICAQVKMFERRESAKVKINSKVKHSSPEELEDPVTYALNIAFLVFLSLVTPHTVFKSQKTNAVTHNYFIISYT